MSEDDEFHQSCWIVGIADDWDEALTRHFPRNHCREPPIEDAELLREVKQHLLRITLQAIILADAIKELELVYREWWTVRGREREAKRLMYICYWTPRVLFICVD